MARKPDVLRSFREGMKDAEYDIKHIQYADPVSGFNARYDRNRLHRTWYLEGYRAAKDEAAKRGGIPKPPRKR